MEISGWSSVVEKRTEIIICIFIREIFIQEIFIQESSCWGVYLEIGGFRRVAGCLIRELEPVKVGNLESWNRGTCLWMRRGVYPKFLEVHKI